MNNLLNKSLFAAVILALLVSLAILIHNRNNAPDLTFTTIEGKKISMADLKGKVVIVNFWATDCLACVTEMPALVNTYQQYQKKGLEIIAVAMPYDPPAQVLNYVTQKKLPFPVMHDGLAEITQKFGNVDLTPTTFIFDKQGKQLQRTIGALDFVKLNQLLSVELTAKN
ncbi:TlpA disulfide reductase family protein [Methylotenera versatilis]|jgi:peroxiredoxin|uniref:Redoxin domain protein n=1 Tax=Methylotenera versatilis (strain 301) TaxID=666681 RepID=D7DMH1_METV0|nr:TlpA disulfide reductase family protein [Methylotenera versatilis]ADI28882.1 Redoxin domain protein [Methylotenera versatilis 301]